MPNLEIGVPCMAAIICLYMEVMQVLMKYVILRLLMKLKNFRHNGTIFIIVDIITMFPAIKVNYVC